MGTYENVNPQSETREPTENGKPAGGRESGKLVRLRLELQHRVVHHFILRRRATTGLRGVVRSAGRATTGLSVGKALDWMARRMRIRVPAYSFRAVGIGALAAVIVGPVTLTLLAGYDSGLDVPLNSISRFSLALADVTSPRLAALQEQPTVIKVSEASDPLTLTAGNIPVETNTSNLSETLRDASVSEFSARVAALPKATPAREVTAHEITAKESPAQQATAQSVRQDPAQQPAAQESRSKSRSASSAWPAPARERGDDKLREGYLWRAWLEGAAKFHAQRAHGKSLTVYKPGEGYAVLDAAYRPMIQPVRPQDDSEDQDRSVYKDRREPRVAPGDQADPAVQDERPPVRQRRDNSLGSPGAQSFQPWDSEAMTEPMGAAKAIVSRVPGLRIERVVLFQGFTTNGYPTGNGASPFFSQNLGYDIDVGAMATISWTRARPTGSLFMLYTPSHTSRMRYSDWNTTDHELTLGATKKFRRWDLGVNSNNGVRGLPQVLFSPAVLRPVATPPATFDGLVQAAEGGQLSSEEIASVLTGTPVVEKQPQTRFDEGQVLSLSLSTTANYSASPRLSFNLGASATHFHTISNPVSADNVVGLQGLNRATSIGGNGGMNYKLSPGTTVGVESNLRRSRSTFSESTSVNTSATISKQVGRRWTVRGGGGMGTVDGHSMTHLDAPARTRSSWIVKGGVAYTGRANTLEIDAQRSLGDSVGLGGEISHTVGANWKWMRPGASWGLYSHANWYRISIEGYGPTQGALAGGGLIRQLTRETSFQAEYSYQMFNSPFRGVVSNLNGQRVQMSWIWKPAGGPR